MGDTNYQSITLAKQTSQGNSPMKRSQELEAQKVERAEKVK
jgi:hypothetical protein